jgi:hypothetical protein
MPFPSLAGFVPAPSGVTFPRGKKVRMPVRLTSHTSKQIVNLSRIHNNSRKEAVKRQRKKYPRRGISGMGPLAVFKAVFVDPERSNLRFQSRGRNAELGCGTRQSIHLALGFRQSRFYPISFALHRRLLCGTGWHRLTR